MPRHGLLQKLLRDLGNIASPSQSHQDEARANVGIRPFPPRPDMPPPEISKISRANVRRVDIIAVHGLGGNWLKTWEADDGAIWLRDRLPQLLAENNIQARILSYGYNTEFVLKIMDNDINRVAGDLLDQILGALNNAWTENIHYQDIVNKAAGCVFLSVTHQGADLAKNAVTIVTALSGHGNNKLVKAIMRSSDEWRKVGRDFVFRTANISIATVFETQTTNSMMVVDQESARLGLYGERTEGLPRSDHRNICKFGDSPNESDRFRGLIHSITKYDG